MINRFNIIAKRSLLKNQCICQLEIGYYRRYTTSNESSDKSDHKPLDDLLDIDHFWELPESASKEKPDQSTETSFTSNFLDILSNHNRKSNTNPYRPVDKIKEHDILGDITAKLNQDINKKNVEHQDNVEIPLKGKKAIPSIIEQKLRDLVLKKKQIYKNKSPLPKSFIHAVYDNNTMMDDTKKRSHLSSSSSNTMEWDEVAKKEISNNKLLQDRDEELKIIDDILSTDSRQDLLDIFTQFINEHNQQQMYPSYYSKVLEKSIQHAYTEFKDPYLAIALFEQCKLLGTESYIQGCTVKVYTEILTIRWEAWKDIYGMLDLMEEMANNGIAFSRASAMLVKKISDEMDNQVWSENENDQIKVWSPDDIRSTQLMKMLVGKWLYK